jgi:hypothetical protein
VEVLLHQEAKQLHQEVQLQKGVPAQQDLQDQEAPAVQQPEVAAALPGVSHQVLHLLQKLQEWTRANMKAVMYLRALKLQKVLHPLPQWKAETLQAAWEARMQTVVLNQLTINEKPPGNWRFFIEYRKDELTL